MLESLLEKIASALEKAAIPYMVIGGQAVLVYGEPRLTKDIDITLGVGLDRLADVLALAQTIPLEPLVDPEAFTRQTMVLPCSSPEADLRVDLIFSFTPYEQLAISRSRAVKVGAAEVRFASLEDLVIHKVIAGRARDLEDVKGVLLRNPYADVAYIRHWLGEFSAATGEDLVHRLEGTLKDIK